MSSRAFRPTLHTELALRDTIGPLVAGLDEVGRGAWAGPVVAAAIILPLDDPALTERLAGVRDSKLMTPAGREAALPLIQAAAVAVGVGIVEVEGVDRLGILQATKTAMQQALDQLTPPPHALLLDAVTLACDLPQTAFPRADRLCLSVAAASVVAKVTRDRLMAAYDAVYPGYGFGRHKGYGTAAHAQALQALGVCPLHRRSFAPVQAVQLALNFTESTNEHE